jgi:hypothetical protein
MRSNGSPSPLRTRRSHTTNNGHARPTPHGASAVQSFLAPRSLDEVKELAKMIALAEWAPECYRDIDGNYALQKLELGIMHGASVGLGPIAAVQSIAIINGKPSIWGDGALSVIEHSGLLEDMAEAYEVDDTQGLIAVCTMKRHGRATPILNRFSTAMADQAGLTRIEGPWQSYPERMLRMRARSWTMRDAFADVLRGLHIREEVEDFAATARFPRSAAMAPRTKRGPATDLERTTIANSATASSDIRSSGLTNTADISSVTGSGGEDQDYTLVNADGVLIEVTGRTALRTEFERLLLDKHLTASQVVGVWESNAAARDILETARGKTPLRQLEDHVKSIQNAAEIKLTPVKDASTAQITGGTSDLRVDIDPTWGTQKIFHRYREAVERYALNFRATGSEITEFRQVNAAIESRLQARLPEQMAQLNARYPANDAAPRRSLLPSAHLPNDAQEVGLASGGIA